MEGALRLGRAAHERLVAALPEAAAEERRRLERDAPLLLVAEAARQKRLAGATGRITERG